MRAGRLGPNAQQPATPSAATNSALSRRTRLVWRLLLTIRCTLALRLPTRRGQAIAGPQAAVCAARQGQGAASPTNNTDSRAGRVNAYSRRSRCSIARAARRSRPRWSCPAPTHTPNPISDGGPGNPSARGDHQSARNGHINPGLGQCTFRPQSSNNFAVRLVDKTHGWRRSHDRILRGAKSRLIVLVE